MGIIRMGIPRELTLKLRDRLNIQNFIETGTFKGGTTFWAAPLFNQVYTIEIDEQTSLNTQKNKGNHANIHFKIGDSRTILPQVVKELKGNSVFWLDGHYSGPGTGGGDDECPIMEELEALKDLTHPVIFIDDARCFLGRPLPPHKPDNWPLIDTIFAYLHKNFPNHFTTIIDDTIVCVPKSEKALIDEDWLTHYAERYPAPRTTIAGMAKQLLAKVLR
jgi:hypothetical protein